MKTVIRYIWVVVLVGSSSNLMAQFGIISTNKYERVHIQKIDSLDKHKNELLEFKLNYALDSFVTAFDTTKKYVLRYSDSIKYDRSSRRIVYGEMLFDTSIYNMDSNGNLYYSSRTFKHEPKTFTGKQILESYLIQDKYLVPIENDSLYGEITGKHDRKTYYDYFTPYVYDKRILVLKQSHGHHGYDHVGLVSFSNEINHYFEVID